MKDKYTISELSRFFNISDQTLRYYDKIGLYCPAYMDEKTNYRYYTFEQFYTLSLIIQLKKMNFSLNEIKEYINVKEVGYLEDLLNKQQCRIEEQITELHHIKESNQLVLEQIQFLKNVEKASEIKIMYEKERYEYQVCINFEQKNLYQYIKIMYDSYLCNFAPDHSVGHSKVVLKISKRNLEQRKLRVYSSVGLFVYKEDIEHQEDYVIIPSGEYAVGYHIGTYRTIQSSYNRILDFITENNYIIIGDSLETAITGMSLTQKEKEYITKIEIPISKTIPIT